MLEYLTLGWKVAGIVVLGFTAFAARSVALAGHPVASGVLEPGPVQGLR